MNKNWPLHFFPVFVGLVWKSINKHIIIPDQKGSSMHWHYLCFYASPEGDLMWMNSIKWYHINFSLSCFISWEKLGHISSCLRMSYCFFFSLHPSIFRTNPWVWMRPEVFCSIQNCCNWGACWECIVWLSLFGISHFVHIICLVCSWTYVFLSIFHPKIYNTQQW